MSDIPAIFEGHPLDCSPPAHPHKWIKAESYLITLTLGDDDLNRLLLRVDVCGNCGVVRVPHMLDLIKDPND